MRRGQLKIQQMAFVLVALFIFFAIAGLLWITFMTAGIREDVGDVRGAGAKELVLQLASMPEFGWTASSCENCVDLDKVVLMKDRGAYEGFFDLDYLAVETLYPSFEASCSGGNVPDCDRLVLIDKEVGTPASAFVSLCRQAVHSEGPYVECRLGRVFASGRAVGRGG
jgi:hypothetical protein